MNNNIKTFTFVRHIFKKYPFLISKTIVLIFTVGLIEVTSVLALIPIIDFLIKPNLDSVSPITLKVVDIMRFTGLPVTLGWLLAIFLVFNAVKSGFQIFVQHSILRTKYTVLRDIMIGTFDDFFNARWYFFSSGKQGTLLNTFIHEVRVVGDALGAMVRFFASILQVIFYFTVPFYLSWQVSSICLAAALFFIAPFIMMGRISYRLGRLNTSTANEMSSIIQQNLTLAKVVLGFGNQHKSVEALDSSFNCHSKVSIKSQTLSMAIPLMFYPLGVLVMIIGVLIALKLAMPLAEAAVLLYSFLKVLPLIGGIVAEKNAFNNFIPSYEQIMDLRRRALDLKQPTGGRIFTGFNNELLVKNLCFAYPGHKPTLTDINIRIPKGKMIAFVGESGAGKSTLIDVIMGFNEATSGEVTVDGIPLREFDIRSYRKRLGYVPQEGILFNMNIRDNLLWANESAGDEEIRRACRQANADEFIEKFPQRYDTLVGDRGVRLSGGQLQRVTLARAIIRKPDLLILDEATSALDTYSERLIQQAIESITKDTTVIVIAHRLSTIANADYIYVLKDGRIAEEGSYADLANIKGYFSHMVRQQTLTIK